MTRHHEGPPWRIDLPRLRPRSMNDRKNRYVDAREKREIRAEARVLAVAARIPAQERVVIELHYIPRDRRRRDPLNLVATLKPAEDGLVDAGIIPDDTPQYSIPTMPVIDEPDSRPLRSRLYLLIHPAPLETP